MKPSVESLVQELKAIGIEEGDVILVTADLVQVGFFMKNRRETMKAWLEVLMLAVGERGTIITVAYTKTFFRFNKNPNVVFTLSTPSESGSLPNAMLNHPKALRSKHPTNSYVAIGLKGQEILADHDHTSLSYSVIGKIIKNQGKHLMLGTIDKKNAPAGLHYAQELTGITKTEPSVGLRQTYYIDQSGQRDIFTRWDAGGCSGGGYKMYEYLVGENAVKFGLIGNSISALINVEKSLEIAISMIKKDRKAFICDDKNCRSCRGRFLDDGIKVVGFYFNKYFISKIIAWFSNKSC